MNGIQDCGFTVFPEPEFPCYWRTSDTYAPVYKAITRLWRCGEGSCVRIPLGDMKPPHAQKKAHQWAERHKFSIETRTIKGDNALWIRWRERQQERIR